MTHEEEALATARKVIAETRLMSQLDLMKHISARTVELLESGVDLAIVPAMALMEVGTRLREGKPIEGPDVDLNALIQKLERMLRTELAQGGVGSA